MIDPLFCLGLSVLLVAVSLTAVLIAALPAIQEISRAARSAEKLFDTLRREFPPTLEAIRLTGLEISEFTDELNEGVKSASEVVKQVDEGITSARQQVRNVHLGTRSVFAGVKAAWKTFGQGNSRRRAPKHINASLRAKIEPSSSKPFNRPGLPTPTPELERRGDRDNFIESPKAKER